MDPLNDPVYLVRSAMQKCGDSSDDYPGAEEALVEAYLELRESVLDGSLDETSTTSVFRLEHVAFLAGLWMGIKGEYQHFHRPGGG
jgi:hypothetical protein